ncbi:MAG: hypothetical protein VXZ38_08395 [Planctomycetota bacterium]|nr:hypothetical protein [Planctomycetota bacterium]
MDNYYTDPRVLAANSGGMFKSIDTQRMVGVVEYTDWDEDDNEIVHTIDMPICWEVCDLCNGKGSHVNPSIDCNGLSREDFHEDPDFAEAYWRGDYDQVCNCCGGRTTVPVVNDGCLNDDQKKHLQRIWEQAREEAEYQRECAWERRMGC